MRYADRFEEELARVVRREQRLRAALRGDAAIKRVHVKAVRVRAHSRGAHDRLVIVVRKK